jgi:hypothetical protein
MSKERELLERHCNWKLSPDEHLKLLNETKTILAQPETEPSDAEIITAYQMLVRRKLGLQEKNEVLQLGGGE